MPLKTVLFKKKNIWVQRICEKNYKIIGSKKTEMAYYMYPQPTNGRASSNDFSVNT